MTVKQISKASLEELFIYVLPWVANDRWRVLCMHTDEGMDNLICEIVEIEDASERMNYFEKVFIRKRAKV